MQFDAQHPVHIIFGGNRQGILGRRRQLAGIGNRVRVGVIAPDKLIVGT